MGCSSSTFTSCSNSHPVATRVAVTNMTSSSLKGGMSVNDLPINDLALQSLYAWFCKLDLRQSGSIVMTDLQQSLGITQTKFFLRIFSYASNCQLSAHSTIGFEEFVISFWSFCSLDRSNFNRSVFEMYSNNGELFPHDLKAMLLELHGSASKSNKDVRTILLTIHSLYNSFSYNQFYKFCREREIFLLPAMQLQSTLRKKILSEDFWATQEIIRTNKIVYRDESTDDLTEALTVVDSNLAVDYSDSFKNLSRFPAPRRQTSRKSVTSNTLGIKTLSGYNTSFYGVDASVSRSSSFFQKGTTDAWIDSDGLFCPSMNRSTDLFGKSTLNRTRSSVLGTTDAWGDIDALYCSSINRSSSSLPRSRSRVQF